MIHPSVQHYSSLQLVQLLHGEIGQRDEMEITMHISKCETCRDAMEQLAADRQWWQEIPEQFSDSAAILRSPRNQRIVSQSTSTPHRIPSLHFLAPSDNPAMLGRLGEYDVLEFLGMGGMGIVLKGYDYELNRYVAIKALAPHLISSGIARKRFARESQAAAAILHPNIVPIHSVHGEHSVPYFVMGYIPGETLQHRLDRTGPLTPTDLLRIGLQIAEGLAAAHGQGVVHRDIKPANILLERNVDRALIVDFGLARSHEDGTLTLSGTITGTPEYMSPEQAQGEIVDPRTDIYSLGSVLYAMATGSPPFRADSPLAVLRKIMDTDPKPVHAINSEMPFFVSHLILQLQVRDRDLRIQSAAEAADLLRSTLAHVQQPSVNPLPERLVRPSPLVISKPLAKGNWTVVVFAIALITVISTSSFVAWNLSGSPSLKSSLQRNSNEVSQGGTPQLGLAADFEMPNLLQLSSNPEMEPVVDACRDFLKCIEWDTKAEQLKLRVPYETAKGNYAKAYEAAYAAQEKQCEIRNRRRNNLLTAKSGLTIPGFDLDREEKKQQETLQLIESLMGLSRELDRIAHQFDPEKASQGKNDAL